MSCLEFKLKCLLCSITFTPTQHVQHLIVTGGLALSVSVAVLTQPPLINSKFSCCAIYSNSISYASLLPIPRLKVKRVLTRLCAAFNDNFWVSSLSCLRSFSFWVGGTFHNLIAMLIQDDPHLLPLEWMKFSLTQRLCRRRSHIRNYFFFCWMCRFISLLAFLCGADSTLISISRIKADKHERYTIRPST